MKTLRLTFKLIGVVLAAVGIGGCGDDDSSGIPDCITCTYSYGTYTYTYAYCKNDPGIDDIFDDLGVTSWSEFVSYVRALDAADEDLNCE